MDSLSILGTPTVAVVNQNNTDLFVSSSYEFIRFCLHETAKALHHLIVYTYQQQTEQSKKYFFLVGFQARRSRRSSMQVKVYGDPSVAQQGREIKWILKNLRWHMKDYAKQLNVYDDVLDDITGFLLFDIIQNGSIDSDDDMSKKFNKELITDAFDSCLELVSAISESENCKNISQKAQEVKSNLESVFPLVSEFFLYRKRQNTTGEKSDTKKVLDFLKSDLLINTLQKEALSLSTSGEWEKPITMFFLHTIIPRFTQNKIHNDFVDDITNLPNTSMDGSMIIVENCQSTPVNKTIDRVKATSSRSALKAKGNFKSKGETDEMDGSFVLV